MKKIIDAGAEAIIFLKNNKIHKKRIKKNYRHEKIDEKLGKKRTRTEARNIERISSVINVPKLAKVDEKNKEIIMQHIKGKRLSEHLNNFSEKKQKQIARKIGNGVGKMHEKSIIHGDLTTSNLILSKNKIFFIDFGLSFFSKRKEDKAVDLHLLKQALEAKHFQNWEKLYKEVIKFYKPQNKKQILNQMKKVEKRGRHKQ